MSDAHVAFYIDTRGGKMYLQDIDYLLDEAQFTARIDRALHMDFQQTMAACDWMRDNDYGDPRGGYDNNVWRDNIRPLVYGNGTL